MFELESSFKPTGDQPNAIKELSNGLKQGSKYRDSLGQGFRISRN